ncbi:hypothetical protein EIELFIGP_01031 [Stenotrophomonas maltophilia]|nr:hypothetical protein EIELFIGP_01031 [Stenotrophomonas maltophilia]BBQ12595.1 hypothetical protein WP1W18C01_29550 [Stenotrophomonas maltophilia]
MLRNKGLRAAQHGHRQGRRVCAAEAGAAAGAAYQPIWWPPLMSRLLPVIHEASSATRKDTP